tara:strand:- start:359 stop:529 length:171 start_codon:yes stop_codon:yes gene_type:complete
VVLSVAEQMCRIRHSWSRPEDETGPSSVHLKTSVRFRLIKERTQDFYLVKEGPVGG